MTLTVINKVLMRLGQLLQMFVIKLLCHELDKRFADLGYFHLAGQQFLNGMAAAFELVCCISINLPMIEQGSDHLAVVVSEDGQGVSWLVLNLGRVYGQLNVVGVFAGTSAGDGLNGGNLCQVG